MPLWQ